MSEDRKVQLGVSVDAGGVKAGLDPAKQAVKEFAQSFNDLGTSSDREVKKMESAVRRAAVQVATAGKSASEALTITAQIKGVDTASIAPKIAALKALEDASLRAGNVGAVSFDRMGMSAKATANALRGVPAQFTDIVVSLQGGQAPLTVFLQQGGQLKDMFGGAGNAARALGGYVAGLVNPFTLAAAGVAALGYAYFKGSQEAQEYSKAIILSGNVVGTTASQLQGYAQAIGEVTGSQGAAASALAEFAQKGKVGAENLQQFSQAAIQFEKVTGTAVSETVKQFAELAKSPVDASVKLNEQINYLTVSVYKQIKALEDQGRATEAADLAQKTFAGTIASRAGQIVSNVGLIEGAWNAVKRAILGAADAALNVGRAPTQKDRIDDKRGVIGNLEGLIASGDGGEATVARRVALLEIRKQELSLLTESERVIKRTAESQSQQADITKKYIDFTKQGAEFATKAEKREKEITKATLEGQSLINAGLLTQVQLNTRLAGIREKYKESAGPKGSVGPVDPFISVIRNINERVAAVKLEIEQGEKLTAGQKLAAKVMEDVRNGTLKITQAKAMLLSKGLEELLQGEALRSLDIARLKATEDSNKERQRSLDSITKETATLQDQIRLQQDQNAGIGLTKEAIAALTTQRELDKANTLQAIAVKELDRNLDYQKYEATLAQVEAMRALAREKAKGGALQTVADEAEKATKQWTSFTDTVNKGLTDSLFRAFESGKGFFKTFWDGIKNLFKTTVLKLAVQGVMGGVTGALGLAGTANAATGAGGLGSLTSLASSASSLVTVGGQVLAGSMSIANALGTITANATGTGITGLLATNGAYGTAVGAGGLAGAGASITSALGEIGPAGWAAIAAIAAISIFKGKKESASVSTGSLYRSFDEQGNTTASRSPFAIGNGEQIVGAIQSQFMSLKDLLGAKGGSDFSYNAYSGNGNKGGKFNITGGNFVSGEIATDDAAIQLAASRAILSALQASEMPKGVAKIIDSINPAEASAEQIKALQQNAAAYSLSIKSLNASFANLPFKNLKNLAFDVADALVAASGGLEALGANLTSYQDNFYSDAEKRAQKISDITRALNGAGVGVTADEIGAMTRLQYRALVESIGAVTEANAPAVAALYATSAAFASITPAIDQAATGITDTLRSLRNESGKLSVDLLRAQGNTTGADEAQRTLDTSGFTAAEIAVFDYNASIRAQIAVLNAATEASAQATAAAAQATAAVAAEREGLQSQLNALTDTSAQALARQRDALDASNRSLFDQVQAAQAAAAAVAAFGGAMQGISDTRLDLQAQLLTAQGDTAGAAALIRQTDLARLTAGLTAAQADEIVAGYDGNNAIRKQIADIAAAAAAQQAADAAAAQSAQASASAAQQAVADAQRAADQIRAAYQSITDSLFDEVARIRGLTGGGAQSFAEAQTNFSIAAAQASSGDQSAATALPELSRILLQLAETNATSLLQLRAIQGQTAGSLEGIANQFVSQFGLAQSRVSTGATFTPGAILTTPQGQQVPPAVYNPALGQVSNGNADLIAEIRLLRAEVELLKAPAVSSADSNQKTADILKRVTRSGDAMQTQAFA